MKSRITSFRYALTGIKTTFRSEINFKIHCIATVLVILFGLQLEVSVSEWLVLLACIGMVLTAELLNTAIEAAVDLFTQKKCAKAMIAKDAAAGGVLVSSIAAAIIGMIIFLPKILH